MRLRYEKCMQSRAFKEPMQKINEKAIQIDMIVKNMQLKMSERLNKSKNEAATIISKLDALSPLKTLSRGYCITELDGKIVKTVKNLKKDDEINIKFTDGEKLAKIM